MTKRMPRDGMNENARFADVLRRVLAAAANPATAGRALADEILRFTAARMVVLVQEDVGDLVPVVAPDNHRALVEHAVIAALLREVSEIETFRFYSSDTPIAGLDVILSPENQTNCLAVPLKSGGVRVGAVLIFGLARGKEIDVVTGNVEKLAPLLGMVLRNASLLRHTQSKPSELVFRESNARFQELVHCLPVPVALYDAQGNFLLINDRLTAIYGYSLENVPDLSRYWPNAFPSTEARAQAQTRWSAALAEAERIGSPDIAPEEYLVTCKDGTVRVTEVFGTRLGDAALVVFNDVTARRLAEAELENNRTDLEKQIDERTRELRIRQERLEIALEATNTGSWEWNPMTGKMSSPTYYTMLGWKPGEFPESQDDWTRMVHPDDWPAAQVFFQGIATSPDNVAFSHEYRLRSKQGSWRWIFVRGKIVGRDEHGKVNRVVGVYIDISERKAEEKRLRMAMQALETTRECVYWIDEDGKMLYVNPATAQELGYSSDELLQMSIPDIDPNTPQELWGPEGELTRRLNVEGLRKFLTYHRHRDGHLIPVEVDSDAFHFDGQTCFIAITRDISARLAAEEALHKSEAKFSAMFSLTPEPMALTRLKDGMVIEASSSFAEHFGNSTDVVIGRSTLPGDLNVWVDPEQRRKWTERLARDDEALGFETQLRRKDGSVSTVLLSGKVVNIGGEKCVLSVAHDITQQKEQAAHLEQIAHHDPLTGLPNRLLLGDRLRQAIARNQRGDHLIAVCYLDLDGFKEVNDRYGHEAGDGLLIEVTNRLTACVRGGDTVARLGGDEFVILFSGLANEEECRIALDRLLQTVSHPYAVSDNEQAEISASVGVTLFPNDQVDPDTLVRHADHAMYAAKQAGKDRYQMFDTRLELRIEARLATLGLLAEAQKSGQFRLYYQPKVDCRHGRIVGAEALIRWQHPTLGLLSPAEFLPLVEDTDLALSIGEWVIREAVSQMARWRHDGINLHVSVNAFVRHLLHPGFADALAAILSQYPEVDPSCLMIEIVETAALKELDAIRQVIEDCKKLGVAFSLDDFGTGYSTLAHLRHLPATEIKIDHTFVCHMLERTEDIAIVEAVIGMARAFGRSMVAEGAETPAHILLLRALGCDVVQGYALARPMPAADIPNWVREFIPDPAWYRPAGDSSNV